MKGKFFKTIDDLKIKEDPSVCPVLVESKFLAKLVSREAKSNVLDMGTGSGYIALLLARSGFSVTGVDKDPKAIENARENAAINSLKIDIFRSDLFSEVKDKYDIIVFNIPTFAGNKHAYKLILLLTKIFPVWCRNYLSLLHELPLIRYSVFKNRKALIVRFISGCKEHLNLGGKIFVCASRNDLDDIIIPYCKNYFLKMNQMPVEGVVIKRYIARIDF